MSVNTDGVCFCTREDVQRALDASETWRSNTQIDRLIEANSRNIEGALNRNFAPILETRYFPWPSRALGTSWRLWLDENELLSDEADVTITTANGATTLTPGQFFLEPVNSGPPYDYVEVNLGSDGAFSAGSTPQRAIAITGTWGYHDRQQLVGTTSGTFAADADLATIADGALAGVGSVLLCESERLLLTERLFVTSNTTLSGNLGSNKPDTFFTYTAEQPIYAGEILQIDGEQMLVQSITGTTVTVKRGWNGTVLAGHTSGVTIYANRQFKVTRGALGTTAASHADGTQWTAWVPPGSLRTLAIAETLNSFQQERAGYVRTIGSGDYVRNALGAGIEDIRAQATRAIGRQLRMMAV